ncbi:MAG: S41 family peptidase [Chloroflexota bacterium]|nr:S41 family peptidase [Chloroflexota bacterium]
MHRALLGLIAFALIAGACLGPAATSPSPTRTVDIKRSKLDIAYSAFVDQDVHHVTSKRALESSLAAVKAAVRRAGGTDEVATPSFQDVDEPQIADFKKFADAVSQLAVKNPQVSTITLADTAIGGMIDASPDCHTFYVGSSAVRQSRPFTPRGANAMIPSQGTSLGGPDEAGLTGKMLPGGIAYVTFRQFVITGNYKIPEKLRALLDKAVAQGAKAWLFDLRGNLGGVATDIHSMFLNGEPTFTVLVKSGAGGTATANKDLRLPPAYQLPIVVIMNDRSASDTEIFALSLKENNRGTIVGQKSIGCLGAASPNHFSDGNELSVVTQEFTGAISGAKYNNAGIPPDVEADDATAVDKSIEILKQKLAP